jgi:uncharacterized protein YbjT (DUF2867 family)
MASFTPELFCADLPSKPQPEIGKILVTGANGYIGGRLIPELLNRGYDVRVMVRKNSPEYFKQWPGVEISAADALDRNSLSGALKGIHTAYYLIHSLLLGQKSFEKADLLAATNFRNAAEEQGVKRIIYLSGLGNRNTKLSPHLDNRMKVADYLAQGSIPITVLRAGMIIGAGSASYQILRNLVDNTPVFLIPKWAKTKSQPISVRGVMMYLIGVLEQEETAGKRFDIGGPDIVTYVEKLKILAGILGKKRFFLPSFLSFSSFYGTIAGWLSSVPKPVCKILVEGCKNEVICQNNDINKHVNIECLSFKASLLSALSHENKIVMPNHLMDHSSQPHKIAI